ncbi:MAG TPA: cadherin-like beta sandwich domain-containing protein [Thermodesulfobacteriota bacterium]|nr:cadherin-like beta sandwich domain-containing protein [Thermodesulfobacteriota bacterium]
MKDISRSLPLNFVLLLLLMACGSGGGDDSSSPPPSSNADLLSLSVSNGVMNPSFDPSITAYTSMFIGQPSIAVTATTADPGARITVNGTAAVSGQPSQPIPLNPGPNAVTVVVTAADGVSRKNYAVSANFLALEAYIKASNTNAGDFFGSGIALSGDTLAVGAPSEAGAATGVNGNQGDNSARYSGAVYVFVRSGTTWTQQAYIKASNTNASDYFGTGLALSGDTLAVGAPGESSSATGINGDQADNNAYDSGAVYVFVRSGTTWTQQAYIKASNTNAYDHFGSRVALSGDTLAVGAPDEDSSAAGVDGNQGDNSAPSSGAVYVFTRSGANWTQQAYIKASNANAMDYFGSGLALSGDTLAVGAYNESSSATGVNGNQADNSAAGAGAVYIFARAGTTWAQQAYIKASNANAGDNFGSSMAVSGDTLAVGAPGEASSAGGVNGNQADNSAASSGAVYVFTRSGANWTQQAYIKASNTNALDYFGSGVSLSGDTLAVGAYNESSGATAVNGNQADNSAGGSGAVYLFLRSGGNWAQQAYIKASNTGSDDLFGYRLSLSGDTLAVGAYNESSSAAGINGNQADNTATGSGAVYLFR